MAFNPNTAYAQNDLLVTEGFEYILDDSDPNKAKWATINLAFAGPTNSEYQKEISSKLRKRGKRKVTPEQDRRVMIEVFAATIVKGWKNFITTDGAGKDIPLPFSKHACIQMLVDNKMFFEDIAAVAGDERNFEAVDIDSTVEEAKKS